MKNNKLWHPLVSLVLLSVTVCTSCTFLFNKPYSVFSKDKSALEDMIGMPVPDYRVVDVRLEPEITWLGDCNDSILIEFDSIPSAQFIRCIQAEIESYDSTSVQRWQCEDGHTYIYWASVDDGGRVPKAWEGKHDWSTSFAVCDTSRNALIRIIQW